MRLSDFDFELPEDRIALRPAAPRDSARMLVTRGGGVDDRHVRDLPDVLRRGDVVVFNDTKVVPARLHGERRRGASSAKMEFLLLRRVDAARWTAMARPAKRLSPGDEVTFGADLRAFVEARGAGGEIDLRFDVADGALDEALRVQGAMPLPPYILSKRAGDERDRIDYQTTFAKESGSVAAPTAGLHFTPGLMNALEAAGIARAFVTLHVGAGTFLPVKTENLDDHRMHAERGLVSAAAAEVINRARGRGGRVICVGTTALRLLETAALDGELQPWSGETDIFIRPGYRFRLVDGLVSNFHLPRSTLLMLVSALAGYEEVRRSYAHALAHGYRFYSYGDAGLWFGSAT